MKNSVVSFWLPDLLMGEAKSISATIGVPVSRLVRDGLTKQIERYQAIKTLIKPDEIGEISRLVSANTSNSTSSKGAL